MKSSLVMLPRISISVIVLSLISKNLSHANLHSTYLGGAILAGADLHCLNNPVCVSWR
ncbi:MAG: pentapeptide repeat-containing protein [Nitrosotalea sp.]